MLRVRWPWYEACSQDRAGTVALGWRRGRVPVGQRRTQRPALPPQYQRSVTLESFSVLLAQMLARSLGMSYDNNRSCHCPGHICVMNSEAL